MANFALGMVVGFLLFPVLLGVFVYFAEARYEAVQRKYPGPSGLP